MQETVHGGKNLSILCRINIITIIKKSNNIHRVPIGKSITLYNGSKNMKEGFRIVIHKIHLPHWYPIECLNKKFYIREA